MRRVALGIALATAAFASDARGDAFYYCTKKGAAPYLVNTGALEGAKRNGYRCTKRMEFGDSTERARPDTRDRSKEGRESPAPRHFVGPAGERETFEAIIIEAARRYNVPANLVRAVIKVESDFRPQAVSTAGAKGLMQLMPGTAKEMGVSEVFDPRQNILGGVRYLRLLINRFEGDAKLAIAAYHAGPAIVAERGGIPYKATERYVRNVLTHYFRYKDSRLQ